MFAVVRILLASVVFLAAVGFAPPAPAQEAVQDPPAPAPATAPAESAVDPGSVQREALFDIAFHALATGNLDLAEQAFGQAADLPGDVAKSAVAASFVERVRRLRATRPAPPHAPAGSGRAPAVPPLLGAGPDDRASGNDTAGRDRSGHVPLLLTTSVLGLAAYGWMLPTALGVPQDKTFLGLYMLAASASFAIPYLTTATTPVSSAQANLAFYGGTRGLWHGLLFSAIFAGNLSFDQRPRGFAGSMLVGSLTEAYGGYLLANRVDMTPGQARTIAVGGDAGFVLGMSTGFLLGLDRNGDGFDDAQAMIDAKARRMAAATFLGAVGGLTAGYFYGRHSDHTWGDGEVLRATATLGALYGMTVADLLDWKPGDRDGQRGFFGLLMLGMAGGLVVGDRLVSTTDFSVGQSLIIDVATVAGGLGALGVTVLLGNSGGTEKPLLVATSLGGALGFGLSYWAFHGAAESKATARLTSALGATRLAVLPLVGDKGQKGVSLAGAF